MENEKPAEENETVEISDTTKDSTLYISEGKAKILNLEQKNVFYNPVQEFNRDLRFTFHCFWNFYST